MTPDENETAETTQPGTDGAAETANESPPSTITVDGKEYTTEEVLAWRDKGLMQADYTKKTTALADKEKEYKNQLAERDRRIAELSRTDEKPTVRDFSGLNEYVPGLGEAMGEVMSQVSEIKTAQGKAEEEAAKYVKAADYDEAMTKALREFEGQPYANLEEMRGFMETRGFGPEHVDVVYHALYGEKRGEVRKEAAMRERKADAPPSMGPSRVAVPGSSAEEVVGIRTGKSMRETSFQELRNQALNDPRRPKVTD
jgi:hypothetical protein